MRNNVPRANDNNSRTGSDDILHDIRGIKPCCLFNLYAVQINLIKHHSRLHIHILGYVPFDFAYDDFHLFERVDGFKRKGVFWVLALFNLVIFGYLLDNDTVNHILAFRTASL